METEKNKQLVKRYLELWNTGDPAIAAEILAPDYVDHTHPNREPGPESMRQEAASFRAAFPDARITIEQMIGEGDTVAFRFGLHATHQGQFGQFPPTGKEVVLTGMDFVRIVDGKLVELWSSQDTLSWVQQLSGKIQ
jgi:steroid delta-isomerase-like uncharacterized protein